MFALHKPSLRLDMGPSSKRRVNGEPPENSDQNRQSEDVHEIEHAIRVPDFRVVIKELQKDSQEPETAHKRAKETAECTGSSEVARETETEDAKEPDGQDDIHPVHIEDLPKKWRHAGKVFAHSQPSWQRHIGNDDGRVNGSGNPDQA
jgi:hypothetical protein